MMNYIIETRNISKHYGNLIAVNKVSIGVKKGEIYGFLGLNGAGKTTTIKMLLGMIKPTEGEAIIYGKKILPGEIEIWQKVGYIVEIPYSYPELTVKENLELFYKLRQMKEKNMIDRIIQKLKLSEYCNVKAQHLSQGNLQRLGLAKALIHDPDILILDEPINGLDPAGIVEIREMLKELSCQYQKTIFISSHILSEISKLADRIGIIQEGRLIKEIDEKQLQNELTTKLIVKTRDNTNALKILLSKNVNSRLINDHLEIFDKELIKKPEDITVLLTNYSLPPFLIHTVEEDLEHYFLRIIGVKN